MIAGTTYLLRGEPVTAVIAWRQQRGTERLDCGPHLALSPWTPKNVLIRHEDGTEVVRPFRGLRRPAMTEGNGVMASSGIWPQIACPGCGRENTKVAPSAERIARHTDPSTGDQCSSSGRQIDLYGTTGEEAA
ncbi:hypothetical protein ABZ671_00550 [Micromonospora sp. NPDC006766]|uniref:hypothetical protein n=1 Tax=Micromonospora sp. NPDC006766 TaxID=3154778 RepID=UPI00340A5183